MATNTGAFFAGFGTTFVVLAVGFGGGLMMAKSAMKESGGYQTRAASEALTPARVILSNSAEAAQPSQQQSSSSPEPAAQPTLQPAKQVQAPVEKQVEKADTKIPEAEERERKRRYAERKARRQAEARGALEQREQQKAREREAAPIMAFGANGSPRGGFFGN